MQLSTTCKWLSHVPTGHPWPRTTAVAGSTQPSCIFLLAALEPKNRSRCRLRSTLRPSRLEPLTCWNIESDSSLNGFGRDDSRATPLSVASAAPFVTARLLASSHPRYCPPSIANARIRPWPGPVIAPDVHDPACLRLLRSSLIVMAARVGTSRRMLRWNDHTSSAASDVVSLRLS